MRIFKILPVLALGISVFQGCSSTNPPPTPPPATSVTFTANAQYTFNQDKMDTAMTGMPEHRDSSNRDVITSTVLTTTGSYSSQSGNVVIVQNSHSNAPTGSPAMDTSYYYQSSGDLYQYNYGLATLNSIAAFVAVLGKPLDAGWVLQAKLGATAGTTWRADSTALVINYGGFHIPTTITDYAAQKSDTTVVVNGKSLTAKHCVHSVVASVNMGAGSTPVATIFTDSYVTPDDGSVLNVTHSFVFSAPPLVSPTAVAGIYTVLTSMK